VYAYVKQNPWSSFDPLGLEAKVATKPDDGGGKTTTIKLSASIVNKTGHDYTIRHSSDGRVLVTHQQEMENIRDNIVAGIKARFTDQDGNHRFNIEPDIRIVNNPKEARPGDHIINIVHWKSDVPVLGQAAGLASNGGITINLQEIAVRAGPSSTAGHELGHSLGLKHPDVDGTTGLGKDPNNPIKNLDPQNFMGYGGNANKVDSRQIDLIQHFHDQGDLNGAHYTNGKWSSPKTNNQVFGTERFKSGQFPEMKEEPK
jgi:hypothetical protein